MENLNDRRNRLWEEIHRMDSPTYHFREKMIQSLLPYKGSGKRALDIGCGTGQHVCELLLRGFFVDALDPSSYAVEATREKAAHIGSRFNVYSCGIEDFKADSTYDFILASEVLEHVEDDSGALRKISSYLTAGGRALITVPHDRGLWSASDEVSGHLRRYGKEEIRKKLISAGLNPVTLTCYGFPFLQLLFQIRRLITRKEGERRERVLQENFTERKAGRFFLGILNKVSAIDRLQLFPERGVGLVALVEKRAEGHSEG